MAYECASNARTVRQYVYLSEHEAKEINEWAKAAGEQKAALLRTRLVAAARSELEKFRQCERMASLALSDLTELLAE